MTSHEIELARLRARVGCLETTLAALAWTMARCAGAALDGDEARRAARLAVDAGRDALEGALGDARSDARAEQRRRHETQRAARERALARRDDERELARRADEREQRRAAWRLLVDAGAPRRR